jgi:uncharacterized membrane protein
VKTTSAPSVLQRILAFLYIGFALAFVAGAWVHDIAIAIFALSLLSMAHPQGRAALREIATTLHQNWRRSWTYSILGLFTVMYVSMWALHVASLKASYIDFGHYLQLVHNYVFHGQPIYTFHIDPYDYFQEHRSLSIYILHALYSLFPSAVTVALYQAAGYIAPIWVFAWWARKKELPEFQVFLCGFLYMFTATFLSQITWPYTAHILGFVFLSLAYAFFNLESWWAWGLCLILLALEKEDFGLISLSFALVGLFRGRDQKGWLLPSAIVLLISLWGLSFQSENRGFDQVFGHLGDTPGELVTNMLTHPWLIMETYLHSEAIRYMLFFFLASGIWLHFSAETFSYFFPVVPTILVNCLGDYSTLREIGSYYALLVNLGTYAALCLTLLASQGLRSGHKLRLGKSGPAIQMSGWLIAIVTAQFCLAGKTVPREFMNSVFNYIDSGEDRKMAEPYRDLKNENLTLCCEREVCGGFSQHVRVYEMYHCFEDPQITDESTLYLFDRSLGKIPEPKEGFTPLMQGQRFSIYRKNVPAESPVH